MLSAEDTQQEACRDCQKRVSFRASAHTGVGIPWVLEHFLSKTDTFPLYFGDCHTSLRAGSQ